MEIVYFIQAVTGGPIKIGITKMHPRTRLDCMQTGHPEVLQILGIMPGGEDLEIELQAKFLYDHYRGEWYVPSKRLLTYIRKHARSYEELVAGPSRKACMEDLQRARRRR